MIPVFLALASLVLPVPSPATAQHAKTAAAKKAATAAKAKRKAKRAPVKAPDPELAAAQIQSDSEARVIDWVAATADNHGLPYAVVDKTDAALFLFDAKGTPLGKVPVLVGVAQGDEATPGIGSKNLAEIGPAEKTTPAGRFLAKFGYAGGHQKVLWVDYATSVALHPIPPGANKKEHRRERMLSPTPDDNRITFGCINVPSAFYAKKVQPLFQKKGGYVYVLPDTKPLEAVFPGVMLQPPRPQRAAPQASDAPAAS